MAISARGVTRITDLMESVTDSPDFSFLNDWRPSGDSSFFPRLNNTPEAKTKLDGEDRKKLRIAISAIEEVHDLVSDTSNELSENKGQFSQSISVFHKDGQVSIIAIPVTRPTELAMGGFLLAHDLYGIPNAELFVEDLQNLSELIPPSQGYLKWRWWPVDKDERRLNQRSAAQLLLSATNPGNQNIHVIADLVESRASISAGRRKTELQDWRNAISKLESLKDFPKDAVVITLDVTDTLELHDSLNTIEKAFARQDRLDATVRGSLDELVRGRVETHINSLTIDGFATKVRGQGFARKLLLDRFEEYAPDLLSPDDQEPTVGAILRLADSHGVAQSFETVEQAMWRTSRNSPTIFDTRSLVKSIQLLRTYVEDQKLVLGYPRLSVHDTGFNEFLRRIYIQHQDQARPYPARAQFETLLKLLADRPDQLHLVARSETAVKHLLGSFDNYLDKERLTKLAHVTPEPTVDEARAYFKENPAVYQAILSSLGFNALTLEQISGFLAPELTANIRAIDLDTSGMKSPLRSYQAFAVQYALHQKRVIIGDEMGLGKTVTALGLATHLENNGHSRFLVITPLAVLENWRREILKHTSFTPHVLYGESLTSELDSWLENGGIGLATFESVQKVNESPAVHGLSGLDLVVVDEAHMLKNPRTRRAKSVLPWVRSAERAVLMTGTPLENKLEEFEQLISYVQPQLSMPKNKAAYTAFRKAIAPAYLRRNQVDVLQELPDLQDEEVYIELSDADIEYYKRALAANDWNLARRSKILAGAKSSTVQHIQSIVKEAMENDRKVLIFSFYLDVIDVLQRVLKEDDPYTPLTGALSSTERQGQVDAFTKAEKPGVLLAQITAGGQGLNIQAASVVILVEPQNKPSLEEQAIRRSYRMGQTKNVNVIRLRGKDTIDERWVKMLAEKRKIFDATAGVSDVDIHALDNAMSGQQGSLFDAEKKAWGV